MNHMTLENIREVIKETLKENGFTIDDTKKFMENLSRLILEEKRKRNE